MFIFIVASISIKRRSPRVQCSQVQKVLHLIPHPYHWQPPPHHLFNSTRSTPSLSPFFAISPLLSLSLCLPPSFSSSIPLSLSLLLLFFRRSSLSFFFSLTHSHTRLIHSLAHSLARPPAPVPGSALCSKRRTR